MLHFVRQLMDFRRRHSVMAYYDFFKSEIFEWFRPDGLLMKSEDWADYVRSLSYRIRQKSGDLFFIFNAYREDIMWHLPNNRKGYHWNLALNSSLEKVEIENCQILAPAWSVLVFEEVK